MKTSNLLRVLVPSLALFAASCLQAANTGDDGGSTTGSGSASAGGTSSGGAGGTSGGGTGGTTGSASGGTSGGTTLMVGSACTVGFGGGGLTDPCAAVGLVCKLAALSTMGTCQLPGAGAACNTTYGCVTGDTCVAGAKGSTCVQNCTTTADCSALTDTCDTATGSCAPNTCTTPYAPCNATGTNDGVCLPTGKTGTCLATGTAAAYATCSSTRTGATSSTLCSAGNYCVADPASGGTACLPLCATGGMGGTGGGDGGVGTPDGGALDGGEADGGSGTSDGGTADYSCAASEMCINPNALAGGGGGRGGGLGVCISNCPADGGSCPGVTMCVTIPVGNFGSLCVP